MAVDPIPKGFNSVNAYLVVPNAVEALEFYAKAFGAEAGHRMPGPDGKSTVHAEMRIGNSTIMLTDVNREWGMKSPADYGGSPVSLHLCLENVDAAFERAVAAGCTVRAPVADMFWGDRYGKVSDPYGYEWGLATHVEDVSEEEMIRRGEEWFAQMASGEPG